jgi:hypothetical protein
MVEKIETIPATTPAETPTDVSPNGDEPLMPGGAVDADALLNTTEASEAPLVEEAKAEPLADETVDWEVRATTAEEQLAKSKLDNASVSGSLRKLREEGTGTSRLSEDMDEMRAELASIPNLLKAFADSMSSNDPEEIKAAIEKTQQQSQTSRAQNAFTSRYESKMTRLRNTLPNLPQETQSELTSAWNDEHTSQTKNGQWDIGAFSDILDLARDSLQEQKDGQRDAEIETQVNKRVTEAKSKFANDTGLMDNDSGAASAGGELSDEAFLARRALGDMNSPSDVKRAMSLSAAGGGYGRNR